FLAGIKVVGALTRSGVHDAAALVEGGVVGQNAGDLEREKGVLKLAPFEFAALEGFTDAGFFNIAFGLERGDAVDGEEQGAFFGIDDGVVVVGMKSQRAVVGQ